MTHVEILDAARDRAGGYKVDVSRGERVGRVSSEWFSRPADERYLSLSDLYAAVRRRTERSRTRTVESAAIRVEEPLRQLLTRLKPDAIVLDNVVMFPAIANAGVPWIRVVSCAETEVRDANVPPYLSGCGGTPDRNWQRFATAYERVTAPAHRRFSAFLAECGLKPLEASHFLSASPWLNLLLAPQIIRHEREKALDPQNIFNPGKIVPAA